MAFFKFRKTSAEQWAPPPTPENVETMRKRARYRLAGAVVLVVAGVICFPKLFDKQPRPIAVDIPIEIPDRDKLKPLPPLGVSVAPEAKPAETSATNAAHTSKSSTPVPAAPAGMPPASNAGKNAKPAARSADKEETTMVPGKAAITASKPPPKPVSPDSARTASKLAEKSKDQPAANGRYVVQFGAFADAARAQVARDKVEKLGLKTYTQVAETPEGKKYRVRVGPFEKRAEAEKSAEKIKKLELPAAILVL